MKHTRKDQPSSHSLHSYSPNSPSASVSNATLTGSQHQSLTPYRRPFMHSGQTSGHISPRPPKDSQMAPELTLYVQRVCCSKGSCMIWPMVVSSSRFLPFHRKSQQSLRLLIPLLKTHFAQIVTAHSLTSEDFLEHPTEKRVHDRSIYMLIHFLHNGYGYQTSIYTLKPLFNIA